MGWTFPLLQERKKKPSSFSHMCSLNGKRYICCCCCSWCKLFPKESFLNRDKQVLWHLNKQILWWLISVEVRAELPYLHVSVWTSVTLMLLKHPLSIFLWLSFTKAQTVPCLYWYHCFSSLYRWCFKSNMCHKPNSYPASQWAGMDRHMHLHLRYGSKQVQETISRGMVPLLKPL